MNKIFKVIFSKAKGCYVVVSELAKSAGKGTSASHIQRGYSLTLAAAVLSMMMGMAPVGAVDLGNNAAAVYDDNGSLTIGDPKTMAEGVNKNGKNNTTIGTQTDTLRKVADGDTSGQPMDTKDNTKLVEGEGQAHDLNKSTEAGGSTAVGYYNHNEGDRSTTIGNNAKISNKPVTYYVDADGNKIASPDNAAWYKDASGNPTKVPQVFRDANGNTTATPQYRHTYTEKDPTTGEDVTKTEITSDAGKADKDSGGNPVYNYIKEDNKDKLYSVTLYQAASNSIAAGTDVTANGSNAVAVGYNSKADNSAVAIGDTTAAVENGVAIGKGTKASAEGSIALGKGSEADRDGGIAGWDPKTGTASTKSDVAWKSGEGALSIGNGGASRQITNVAAGSEDSDAVNLAQLKEAMTHYYSVKTTSDTDAAGNNNYLNDGATGDNALAAGVSAVATGDNATAVGTNTYASGTNASAYGYRAVASGSGSVAIGSGTSAQQEGSVAVGGHTQGSHAVQVGTDSTAQSAYSVAVGGHAKGEYSVEVGYGSTAQGSYSTSIGGHAIGKNSIAIGSENQNSYSNPASAGGANSIAIGGHTNSTNDIAIGAGSSTSGGHAIAVGGSATGQQAVSIGGVAGNSQATAVGNGSAATGSQSTAVGGHAGDVYSTAVGQGANATYVYATAVGYGAQSSGYQSAAVGAGSNATGQNAVSLGGGGAWGDYSIALGSGAGTTAHGIAIGQNSGAWGENAIAIGEGTNAWRANSIVLGKNSKSGADKNIEGYDPRTGVASVDDTSTWYSTDEAVSIGRAEERDDGGNITASAITRQLNNLAAGTLDTDAVNVAQLKAATQKVNMHDYSVWSPDTETDTNYTNGGAIAKNSMAAGVSAGATGENAVAIGYGAKAKGRSATVIGKNASATGQYAMAFGGLDTTDKKGNPVTMTNTASGASATAFGQGAQAKGAASLAFGHNTVAGVDGGGQQSVAFGEDTQALGGRSLAFGEKTIAKYNDSVAFGNDTRASSTGATAFGNRTRALSSYSTAWGNATVAADEESTAWGSDTIAGAKLDENGAVTNNYKINPNDKNEPVKQEQMDVHGNLAYIQPNGKTTGIKQMKIDSGDELHDYVVLAGKDGNTYVRDYQGSLWKVNVAADGTVTVDTAAGKNGKVYNGKNGAKESLATTTVKDAEVAITPDNVLTKAHEGKNGYNIDGYANATAFGYSTEASGDNATAFGNDTKAAGAGATAFGYKTLASGENATAFGDSSIAAGKNSLAALGGTTTDDATNAAAIGNGAKATLADSVALGSGAVADRASGAKGYDMLTKGDTTNTSTAWVSSANAIAVGNGSTLTRQITGVAAGSQDTDAVNVAQLKAAGFKVTTQNNGNISSSIFTGDTLDFEGKDNAIVSTSKDSRTITVAVSKTPTFDSATFYNPTGSNNEKVTIANGQVSAFNGDQKKRAAVGVDNQGNGTLFLVNDDLSQAHLYTQSSKDTGNDGITRMYYTSSTDNGGEVNGVHTIAVLDDGINYAGDNVKPNTSEKVVVKHKLNSTMDITGGADTNNLSDNNIGVVATPAEEDEQGNITQKGKLEIKLNKDVTGLNTVTAGTAKIGHTNAGTLKTIQNGAETSKYADAGDYVTGLTNTKWDTKNPEYVSGRAATEDQLKKVSDAVNSAAATAGKHTVVTVNDKDSNNETAAKAGTGAFGDYAGADKGNLLIAAKNDNGQMTYNIKLNDQLAIGQKGEPGVAGKDGKDGKVTVETKGGTTVVIGHDGEPGKDGKDGLFVTGKDGADGKSGVSITGPNGAAGTDGVDGKVGIAGTDGKDAVSIAGKNGVGHIGLTGPKGEKGADGTPGKDGISIDITTDLKSATLDDDKNVKTVIKDKEGKETTIEQAPRIQYKSGDNTYEVATMDDGQKYAGDFGDGASVKLNKTVTIKGNVAAGKTKDDFVDGNIAVVANKSQNGEDAELLIKLNKDLTGLNSATYTTSTKNGDVTTTVVDGTGLKIDNGPSITNAGIDGGKHQITNVASGKDGKMYDTAVEGHGNWNNAANIGDVTNIAKSAADGVQAKSGKNITVDANNKVNLNDNITLGDDKDKTKQVSIDGNGAKITAGDGDNKVTVDGSKGQIVAGGDNGVKIGNIAGGDSSLTIYDKDGNATNKKADGGNYVTNLGNKTWNADGTGSYVSGRAATEDQLHQVESNVNKQIADVNTKIDKVDKHHTEVTVNGGTPAKADGAYTDGNLQLKQTTGEDGQKVYDLKLNDQLKVGQKGDDGKAGKDGNVTVEAKGGTTVVIGHDGQDGKDGRDGLFVTGKDGKDGKSGVSITGPNGVAGRDGVDGKVGIAGKDGRDAVSIAGRDGVGHIGLTGPKGADGKDGTNIDISTVLGKGTLDRNQNEVKGEDKDGTKDQAARIQYQTTVKEADGTTKPITHEVATMDDGMKYGDDFGNTAKVKLNHQLDIVGDINAGKKDGDKKATKDDLSDGNIGIVATDTVYNDDGTVKENGKMTVKLAKDLKGLNSIESNSVTTGNTTINNGGLTIKTGDANRTITMQDGNVNMGGNQIHHVAPGQAPDDAVNVSQLNATNYAVNKLDTRVNRVGANAAALAALHPLDFDPDDKWDFSAGYGHYKDANAAAVGAFYRPNEDTMFSVGGSFGGGENMVNAGISVKLGQGNHVSTSRVAMAKEIKDLKKDVAALKAVVNQQSALIDKLTGVNAGELSGSDDLFPDVPANHWAYEYVTRLKQAGILTGYPDGNFAGDRMMTRYEFAAIVYRAIMAGAAANPSLNKDGTLDRLAREFSSEMKYIRIDTIRKDRNGRPTIQRVRVIKEDEKEK